MEQNKQPHRAAVGRIQLCTWLGAGAVTVGVGTALAVGSGTAQADSTRASDPSVSASADGALGRTHGPRRVNATSLRQQTPIVESQLKPAQASAPLAASSSNSLTNAPFQYFSSSARLSPNPPTSVKATQSAPGGRTNYRSTGDVIATSTKTPDDVSATQIPVVESIVIPAATPKPAAAQGTANVSKAAPLREASAVATITPKDNLDILFSGLNANIGWIPVVGTAINAVKFAIDAVSLTFSVISLDLNQAITELGNLAVDTIGLVPVVGAPVSSLLSQTVLGVNAKLGTLVQQGLQDFFNSDSSWSRYQFSVDAVDVPVGLGGSQAGNATVSKPNYAGVPVIVDIINTGFEIGWSVPLEGRLQLLSLAFS